MLEYLPQIPPVQEPENRLAKGLIPAFSLMVMGLLFIALGFIFRELLLEVYVTQTPLNEIVHKDDYIEMWKTSLRFDAQFAYFAALPGLILAAVAMAGGVFFRYAIRLLVVYVAHVFSFFFFTNVANIHVIGTTGRSFTAADWDAFTAAPFAFLGEHFANYPVLMDIFLALIIGVIFVGLWYRLASVVSSWNLWKEANLVNLLIALFCFIGYMWTCAQSPYTSSSPLRAKDAIVSDYAIMNTIAVSAPMNLYWSDDLQKLGFFDKVSQ